MKISTLQEAMIDELRDLYDAEKQLVRALPRMARSAGDSELQDALRQHLEITKEQVSRLQQVFAALDTKARSKPCAGMKGIVEEGSEAMLQQGEKAVADSLLVCAARKVEHYEIAGYESARSMAQQLGMREAVQLLEQTLREEVEADRKLVQVSKRLLKEASQAGQEEQQPARRQPQASGRTRGRTRTAEARTRTGQPRRARGSQRNAGGSAHPLTDHDEIRRWAEERGAHPACVRGTGDRQDTGMIRLDFPGYTGEQGLEPISWDEWFETFDGSNLALMVQDTLGSGEKSNFNKLVSRASAQSRSHRPRTRTARG